LNPAIDYYFAPHSPWTYLGHARFVAIAREAGAEIRVRPVDLGAIFAFSGGLPLAERPAQRQAYRLVELDRISKDLGLPMNIQPRHFPVPPALAARLVVAVERDDGVDAALRLSEALFAAIWVQERNVSDPDVLAAILGDCELPARRLEDASTADVLARYETNTQEAITAQIFGAPSYVLDGEIFWGQDRLELLRKKLARWAPASA